MTDQEEEQSQLEGMCPHGNFSGSCSVCNVEQKLDNSEILAKAEEILTPEDFSYFRQVLEAAEKKGGLFKPEGKALHTTNNFFFDKILAEGRIKAGKNQEGMYSSQGASFTDGDSEKALTFQTIFDDQNTWSEDKKINSEIYDRFYSLLLGR